MKEDLVNKYADVLRSLLQDIGIQNEEVIENTPRRWIRFLESYSKPLNADFSDFKTFQTNSDDMVIAETHFWSICEHHLLPYFGKVFFGYIPDGKVLGISKIVRFIQYVSKQPSIQEGLTQTIADTLFEKSEGRGVMVLIKGFHTCVASRYSNGWMTTSAVRGIFRENKTLKNEFLNLTRFEKSSLLD